MTGAGGFIASALIPILVNEGHEVAALVRQELPDWPWPSVEAVICDLTVSVAKTEQAVKFARPDVVIHLAASTPPGHAGANEWKVLEENGKSTERLLDACAKLKPRPTVIVASSGAVYGPGNPGKQFSEDSAYSPVTHYGVSKVVGEMLAVRAMVKGLPTVRVRMFNVIGPGQGDHFAISAFARRISQIEAGHCRPEIEVTSLAPTRDFIDVRDTAKALFLLLGKGRSGDVYNICSGQETQIKKALQMLFSLSQMGKEIKVIERSDFVDQIPYHCGSSKKIKGIGWRPQYKLRDTLGDCLEYWRSRIKNEKVSSSHAV